MDSANIDFYQRLFELENVFDGELDFAHLSKNILNTVIRETAAVSGIVYWIETVPNELKIKTISGIPTTHINGVTKVLRQPDGVLERTVRTPEALILNGLHESLPDAPELKGMAEFYRSLMMIPLSVQSKLLGLIILFKDQDAFTQNQFAVLNAFAPRIAVHLDNARLYQVTKETALENARLYVNLSKLYQHATTDPLTGLYNRNFLMQRIREEIKKARRFKQPLSILFVDLDYFKSVNEQYGHQVGDQLLTEFGDFIKKSVREYDVACRFGGEEFVILLPQTPAENAMILAERLRGNIVKRRFCADKQLAITASFGVHGLSETSDHSKLLDDEQLLLEIENLIGGADEALYRAKNDGRNKVILHQELA
ncbi:sensor domain-containing diguanylate cyclase [Hydrogenispora ethanolica]|jgi:diguanylate cyclase (GGDEF)-like protein|nr:sensor domain-containing diguanylate cyclase [Hydrogenispora ethanolica]